MEPWIVISCKCVVTPTSVATIFHVKVGFIIIFLLPLVPRDTSTTATILRPIIQVNLLVRRVIITMETVDVEDGSSQFSVDSQPKSTGLV